jgi:N-acylneuraminate cytidylyltransferase
MKIIGLIPARGGSKGIPKKNLSPIAGTTLVGHKILQAQASYCTEVWVSTDCEDIKNEAISKGSRVLTRPDYLSTDESSTDSMLVHAINNIQCDLTDIIVLLQATSPLLETISIDQCISMLAETPDLNSVITVREAHPFMWITKDDVKWEPSGHSRNWRPRRQDLEKSAWETGGCYAARVSSISKEGIRYPSPTGTISVSLIESLDIDTPEDLEMARNLLM